MKEYLRVRVYEVQWGNFIATYVRYFKSEDQVKQFEQETGFKTEIIEKVTF